jgi:hypothetical protein
MSRISRERQASFCGSAFDDGLFEKFVSPFTSRSEQLKQILMSLQKRWLSGWA